jgi:hypothetical protein
MPSRYLLLKCVAPDEQMSAQPSRTLRLAELQQLVEADSELRWGLDPHGARPVKNSDGSVAMMPPCPGFTFVPDADSFFICYEFYEGLAVHPKSEPRVHRKVAGFAEQLRARLFEI